MKQSKPQLKAWFRRGKYPTEEQFADWMDSYHHKDETVPLASVEGLTDRLNGKYTRTEGEELERKHEKLSADFEGHKQENENEFRNVWEAITDEEERATMEETRLNREIGKETDRAKKAEEDEKTRATVAEGQLQTAITAEQSRAEAQEAAIRKEFAAADEKEKTRATAEETKLDGKIEAETERATGVEGQLQTAITVEQSRAEAQEAAIRKDFAAADATRLKEAKEYTDTKVANIVDSAPETLDTLKELSRALNDDPDFAATVARQMGGKADRTELPGAITEQEIETIFNQ